MINRNLKLNFKQFYFQYRKFLIFTTFGLSIPMIIEGAIELIILDEEARAKLQHNLAAYNAFEFIFCYLMPTIFQLNTLIFGYLRNKEENWENAKLSVETYLTNNSNNSQIDIGRKDSYFDPPLRKYSAVGFCEVEHARQEDFLETYDKSNPSHRSGGFKLVRQSTDDDTNRESNANSVLSIN